jgi:hypothetical protein
LRCITFYQVQAKLKLKNSSFCFVWIINIFLEKIKKLKRSASSLLRNNRQKYNKITTVKGYVRQNIQEKGFPSVIFKKSEGGWNLSEKC